MAAFPPDDASTGVSTVASTAASPITLADVLAIPELANAEILVGADRLDTPIRWVHVAESPRASALIDGGELLMTIGMGFGQDENEIIARTFEFYENGAAAVLVELGTYWSEVPQCLIDETTRLGLPLICIREELKFVVVTEKVHSAILATRYNQIEAFHDVSESFWSLMHNGVPAEQIVLHTGRLLDCPVVLEDLSHRVLCYAAGHELPSLILNRWPERSRQWAARMRDEGLVAEPVSLSDPYDANRTWTYIDIQAQGNHWGRLYYLGHSSSPAGGNYILRHAAVALALERLAAHDSSSWADLGDRIALRSLLGNRFTTVEGERVVLDAEGLPTKDRRLIAAEIRAHIPTSEIRQAIQAQVPSAACLVTHTPAGFVHIAVSLAPEADLQKLYDVIAATTGDEVLTVVADNIVGPVDLASSLHQLGETYFPPEACGIRPISRSNLESLLHELRNDVRVQGFAEDLLGPITLYDQRNGTDLKQCLRVLLKHADSRSAAAAELHLSRTALYNRIAVIERILGTSLDNPEQRFALNLALHASADDAHQRSPHTP